MNSDANSAALHLHRLFAALLPDASRRQQRAADAPLVAQREAPHNQRIQQTSAYGLAPDPQRVIALK